MYTPLSHTPSAMQTQQQAQSANSTFKKHTLKIIGLRCWKFEKHITTWKSQKMVEIFSLWNVKMEIINSHLPERNSLIFKQDRN